MSATKRLAGIPAVVGVSDPQTAAILTAMRERLVNVSPETQALQNQVGGLAAQVKKLGNGSQGVTPAAPVNLVATGLFGAVFLQVDAMPANAAYIEWLASTDNLVGNATVIGQSAVPVFVHYVGDNTKRYYWARGVSYGQNPLLGPLNATEGTPAQAAANPALPMQALSKTPWAASTAYQAFDTVLPATPLVISNTTVAFQAETFGTSGATEPDWTTITALGQTITDGTITWVAIDTNNTPFQIIGGKTYIDTALIRAATILSEQVKSLDANKIVATSLSAISADLGTVRAGTFATAATTAVRAEMSSTSGFPFWIGTGAKSAANALLYVDSNGALVGRGLELLDANGVPFLQSGGVVPGSLDALALKNAPAQAGATAGATWGSNVANQPQTTGNYVNKPNFEDGTFGGWTNDSNHSITSVGGQDFTKAMASIARDTFESSNKIPCSAGDKFFGSAYLNSYASDYSATFGMAFQNSSGNFFAWEGFGSVPPKSGWTKIEGAITAPAGAVVAVPWIQDSIASGAIDPNGIYATQLWIGTAPQQITPANRTTYMANAAIGNAQIENAAVDTLKVAGRAITVPTSAYTAGSIPVGTGWTTVQSKGITTDGSSVFVDCSAGLSGAATSRVAYFVSRILRDGVQIYSSVQLDFSSSNSTLATPSITDYVAAGGHTYTLQFYSKNLSSAQATAREIYLFMAKR